MVWNVTSPLSNEKFVARQKVTCPALEIYRVGFQVMPFISRNKYSEKPHFLPLYPAVIVLNLVHILLQFHVFSYILKQFIPSVLSHMFRLACPIVSSVFLIQPVSSSRSYRSRLPPAASFVFHGLCTVPIFHVSPYHLPLLFISTVFLSV
jgi:hypothetical protein